MLSAYGDTDWFTLIGPGDASLRGGILSFSIKRPNPLGITGELSDRANIMIRDGGFCVHSYINRQFGEGWMHPSHPSEHRIACRVSLYFYNTREECDIFLNELHTLFTERWYL